MCKQYEQLIRLKHFLTSLNEIRIHFQQMFRHLLSLRYFLIKVQLQLSLKEFDFHMFLILSNVSSQMLNLL